MPVLSRAERARYVLKKLNQEYPNPQVPLHHEDPFTLLIAVLLSAQTTDKRVNMVTPALFAKAKTPEQMSKLSVEQILALIRTCGLAPQKAKAISALSKILIEKHGSQVPKSFEELEELPGVGHKTASVVMTQAFGQAAFPVDTHIHRLARRWGLSSGKSVEQTERDLKTLFAEKYWDKLHLQFIYYGREHCTARGCDGHTCEICRRLNGPGKPEKTPNPRSQRRKR